jgi:hypothetical protein
MNPEICRGFPCCEAALFVKETICLLLKSCRNFVGTEMSSYGFRMDLRFTTFKFLLVMLFWFEDLQSHSAFAGLWSESVDFILDFLLFTR